MAPSVSPRRARFDDPDAPVAREHGTGKEEPRHERGSSLPVRLGPFLGQVTGTVIVSETFESSRRVIVASVNATSVTVAVHIGFGHDPGGAEGAFVDTVKRAWPFRGVGKGPD
jgi:hypothetical protein